MNDGQDQYLTIPALARLLGVTPAAIRQWIANGAAPSGNLTADQSDRCSTGKQSSGCTATPVVPATGIGFALILGLRRILERTRSQDG